MQLGMIGLGRMGANIVRRLMRDGHDCVVYDVSAESIQALAGEGADGAPTLEEFVAKLERPRVAWVMIPAGITGQTVEQIEIDADRDRWFTPTQAKEYGLIDEIVKTAGDVR